MDILEFLLGNFLDNDKKNTVKSLIEVLKNNSFDLKSILTANNLSAILPLIKDLSFLWEKKNPTESVGQYHNLSPIAPFADREIVYSLNRYLSSDS
jgi:hypothetical protein